MNFVLTSLVSIAQCDTYLEDVTEDINDLNIDIMEMQTRITSNSSLATLIPSQVANYQSSLTQLQASLAATTDIKLQRALTLQINSLENKLIRLQKRQVNLTGSSILDNQFKIAQQEAELAALIEFQTALETRKTEIQSSANAA